MQHEENYRKLLKGHALLRRSKASPQRKRIRIQRRTALGGVQGTAAPMCELSFLRQVYACVQPAARIAAQRLRRVQKVLRKASQGHQSSFGRRASADQTKRNCHRQEALGAASPKYVQSSTAVRRLPAATIWTALVQLLRGWLRT